MALIGKVVALTGTAYLITDNGARRELQLGDTVQTSDTIKTLSGAEVELELANGRPVHIGPEQVVAFTEELTNILGFDNFDGAVNLATIETVIKAIESGKDINQVLEETAAGNNGLFTDHGFDFVALLRINDVLDNFKFAFDYGINERVTTELLPVISDINSSPNNQGNPGTGSGPAAPPASLTHDAANDTGSLTTDSITKNASPAISGTGTPGDTITLYASNGITVLGTVVVGAGGNWSIDPAANYLVEGPNTLIVKATDPAGNQGSGTTVNVTLDTIVAAPAVALVNDSGSSNSDHITNVGTLNVTGTEPGAILQYSTDGGLTWNNSFTPLEGANTVAVRQIDVAGNTSAASSLSFTLDTIVAAPAVALVNDSGSSNSDHITNVGTLNVTGTEPGAILQYSTDGGLTWNNSFTPLEGANTVAVRQIDVAGNTSAASSLSFTLDTIVAAPAVALVNDSGSSNSDHITNVGTLNVTGTEPGAILQYSTDGGLTWNNSFTPLEGANTVAVRQIDVAGNTSAASSLSFTLDTIVAAPAVALVNDSGSSNSDHITNVGTLNVTGTEPGAILQYSTDGGLTWNNSFTPLEGANTVAVRQIDVAGNTSAASSLSFTLDTVAPNVPLITIVADTNNDGVIDNAELSGATTLTVDISLPVGAAVGEQLTIVSGASTNIYTLTATDIAANKITVSYPTPAEGGTLSVSASLTDTAGNVGATGTDSAKIVTTAPTVSIVEDTNNDGFINSTELGGLTTLHAQVALPLAAAVGDTITVTDGTTTFNIILSAGDITAGFVTTAGFAKPAEGATFTVSAALNGGTPATDSAVIDTTAPATPTGSLTHDATNDTGGSTLDSITSNPSPAISGIGTPGDTITLYAPNGTTVLGTALVGAGGTWSIDPAANYLVEGTNALSIKATDPAGNQGAATAVNVTLDTLAPVSAGGLTHDTTNDTGSSTADSITSNKNPSLTGTSEANAAIDVTVNGVHYFTTANAAGIWTVSLTGANLADGSYTPNIKAIDAAGNTSSVSGTAFTIDANPVAVADTASVVEAGGVANAIVGTPTATGNVLSNDSLLAGDVNTVSAVNGVAANVGTVITGTYGSMTINADGSYTYNLNNSNPVTNALAQGQIATDSFTYTLQDAGGATSTTTLILTVTGTNDAAVISGTSTASITETNAIQSAGGTLTATDVDSSAAFVPQTTVAGSNGYGTFSINAAGVWTYTMNTAHNEFVGGTNYTDSITVATADGTTQVITVTMTGTNDAAVISGTSTASITETNAIQSAGGTLTATDVDSSAAFVPQTTVAGSNGYGTFSINAAGVWTYTMNTAHNEFVGGTNYTDSITVATADGTTQVITVTMTGTNDAAVISGTSTASITETNAIQSAGGTLTATDVDSSAAFVPQTTVAGSNGYGTFSINAAGVWTYTMNTAHNEFVGGTNYTDSITVATADGTTQVITVTMTGTNDAAVISGTSTASITETNAIQSAGGTLTATDVDSSAAFVPQTTVAGSNGYGTFSINAAGVWTYTMNTAHNEFVGGTNYTDSITVATADGTTQVITVTMTGTNDAAVISGTSTASITETNAIQSAGGTLTATDVDSSAAFVPQTTVAGSNGYGTFSINAAGVWTYTMNTAHNEFVGGTNYTDSITVATADGTTQVITVTMTGTNDAAVISGTSTASITETNAIQSAGGTLTATDVDSSAAFVPQTTVAGSNGYGTFSINAAGVWTYTMNTAHNEFVGGTNYTDSITVATADGTTQVITVTMTGTNDAAVISGTSTASITETNAIQSAGGTLTATDVDSSAAFVPQTTVAGSNGYGTFSINAAGVWTYTMNTAHNEFVGGTNYTDSITVATADGTTQVITVTMTGTNDAAVISGTSTASITETNAIQSAGGTLTATDVDSSAAFVPQTTVAGSNGYGTFSINAAGVWTYTMNTAHNEFVGGTNYTDSITVATADGTTQVITVTMTGTNDAAVISGTSTASITETNAIQSAGGTLTATDVDSSAAFVPQTTVAGSNGYGTFSINAAGVWTYTMNTAHNEFVGGTNYTDSITVATADGTTQVITVTMTGTNDAAVISGTSTASITETNAIQSAGGTLTATDVDSSAAFVPQTTVAGSNGYGTFSINAAGVWTYTMNTAHNEFVGGTNYTDSITVATADGTTQVITVTMTGTNDAAVISGTSTASITETNAIQSAGGTLTATDVDSSAAFVPQTTVAGSNGYGTFSINAAGVWTYTMNTAHNEFVGGTNYTDSITVATADGTTQVITVTMTGTNDAAVISGTSTASITETNAIQSAGGTLTATDVDSSAAFVPQTTVAGSNGYGTFSINAAGVWTYTMNTAHNEFVGGTNYTDSITVATADGTTQVITVTMTGTNDAAVISGTSTASITETNAIQSAGGTLTATDVDSSAAFVPQTTVAGSNGYGTFSINAAGVWTYTMNTAHNEFVGGTNYTDSITVATADGTTQVITVTMTGTNDAAVISGTSTASITETNAIQSAGGTLTATDVDSSAAFVPQTTVAGSNGYGTFSINAAGVWTYTMNTAHNEFVGGTNYTDSITVATADGTTQVITVTMTGTNDAAVISGTSTASITETNAIQSAGGTLTATDVDSSAAFVPQTTVAGSNGYGTFSINAAGVWTYTMNTAHNEFVGGTNYTDSITVATADGTTQVITVTMTGTNDAAVISGTSTASITETNAIQSAGGTLTATDVDSSAAFVPQTTVAGSNGYGTFSINAAGVWTYTMNTAHNEFVGGTNYTDSITVATADGTTQVITVTMTGTNDAAVISGTSTASITETNAIQSAGGTLTATDVDSSAAFVPQTTVAGSNGYGTFSINAAGVWTYTMNTAHNEFVGGTNYTDSITVATADGTTQVITVTMTGTNDAAVISGTSTASITETNAIQSAGGTLTATDVDSSAAFVPQTTVAGSNGYGTFSINAAGVWTYTMNTAHNEFVGGTNYTDSITVATADGTTQVITVTMTGTNDAAVISGTAAGSVTEASGVGNAIAGTPTATGTLTDTDVDNPANTFTASSGATTHGSYTMSAAGTWVFTLDNNNAAVQALNVGGTLTDTFTVTSVDGTTQVVSVVINGANDAPTVTPVVQTGTEDTPITLTWAAFGGADMDNAVSSLSVKITSLPADGTLTLNGVAVVVNQLISNAAINAGQLVFTPAANASGYNTYATAGYGNLHHDYTNFNYQVSDGTSTSSTANLVIDVTPVADAPTLNGLSQIYSITAPALTSTDGASGLTQAAIETALGLTAGVLDTFNPPPGVLTSAGNVNVNSGTYTTNSLSLTAGEKVSFDWGFFNGENTVSEITTGGYNDMVVLVITDPLGNKTLQQITSSEQVGANVNGNTVDATGTQLFTATTAGNYQFSWLVLNAIDTAKDSMLSVSAPHYVIGGVTYGQPVDVPVYTALTDTDGSETLSFTISGVPAGAIFSAGTDAGGGTWSFTSAQLQGLQLYPASGFTGTLSLTETATSTELGNGSIASTSVALSINISATTATLFGTTGNETLTATSANTEMLGFSGNDTLNGGSGNDVIYGGAGNDSLNGGAGNDALYGGAGTDTLVGGVGSDVLVGGAGNDTMTGGIGTSDDLTTDVFKWSLADAGTAGTPAVDTINFFGAAAASAGGDVLDIRDLLQGESHTAAVLDAYVHFQVSGGNTTMYISATGAFGHGNAVGAPTAAETAANVQTIVFNGVDLVGAATSDLQVLQNLINNNKLITD